MRQNSIVAASFLIGAVFQTYSAPEGEFGQHTFQPAGEPVHTLPPLKISFYDAVHAEALKNKEQLAAKQAATSINLHNYNNELTESMHGVRDALKPDSETRVTVDHNYLPLDRSEVFGSIQTLGGLEKLKKVDSTVFAHEVSKVYKGSLTFSELDLLKKSFDKIKEGGSYDYLNSTLTKIGINHRPITLPELSSLVETLIEESKSIENKPGVLQKLNVGIGSAWNGLVGNKIGVDGKSFSVRIHHSRDGFAQDMSKIELSSNDQKVVDKIKASVKLMQEIQERDAYMEDLQKYLKGQPFSQPSETMTNYGKEHPEAALYVHNYLEMFPLSETVSFAKTYDLSAPDQFEYVMEKYKSILQFEKVYSHLKIGLPKHGTDVSYTPSISRWKLEEYFRYDSKGYSIHLGDRNKPNIKADEIKKKLGVQELPNSFTQEEAAKIRDIIKRYIPGAF